MAATNSSKFYKEKGLVRTSITLRPETIQTLENMAKQHKLTQGEIVDAFARLLESGNLSDQLFGVHIEECILKPFAKKRLLKKSVGRN